MTIVLGGLALLLLALERAIFRAASKGNAQGRRVRSVIGGRFFLWCRRRRLRHLPARRILPILVLLSRCLPMRLRGRLWMWFVLRVMRGA